MSAARFRSVSPPSVAVAGLPTPVGVKHPVRGCPSRSNPCGRVGASVGVRNKPFLTGTIVAHPLAIAPCGHASPARPGVSVSSPAPPADLDHTNANTRDGEPVPSTSFSGATTTIAPWGGSSRQVRELGQAVLAGAEQEVVDREGRVEGVRGARVGADGLHADAHDRRDLGQPARGLDVRARGLGAVEERLLVVGAGVPAGAQEQPAARRAAGRARSPRPGCRPA